MKQQNHSCGVCTFRPATLHWKLSLRKLVARILFCYKICRLGISSWREAFAGFILICSNLEQDSVLKTCLIYSLWYIDLFLRQVVNLLIEMARTACKSNRKEVIFDPFPSIVHPTKPTEFALHPKKVKLFVFLLFPSAQLHFQWFDQHFNFLVDERQFPCFQNKDFTRVEIAIDSFMSVQSMATVVSSDLKKRMDDIDDLAYPLLQW